MRLLAQIQSHFARKATARRFREMTASFDLAIERARKRHLPVRGLIQAKSDFVHSCLAGRPHA